MELVLLGGLLGTGYYLSRDGIDKREKLHIRDRIPDGERPNGDDIYTSERSRIIRIKEQRFADDNWKRAMNPEDLNVIPQFYNRIDYGNNNDSLQVRYKGENVGEPPVPDFSSRDGTPGTPYQAAKTAVGGREGFDNPAGATNKPRTFNDVASNQYSSFGENIAGFGVSLTGEPIDQSNFSHNNMIPMFGGRIKQNTDEYAHSTTLETFTGTPSNYQQKKEIPTLFDPVKNLTNPYGTQNLDASTRDRYIPSDKRQGERPIELTYVGPGLNKGFTSEPSGGFHQADTRDYVLPKTVNELRTKDNPKLSYKGRLVPGQKPSQRGFTGELFKNRPDTFWVNSQDRYFTTAVEGRIAQQQYPNIVLRHQQRPSMSDKTYEGPATSQYQKRERKRPGIQKARRTQFDNDGFRNAGAPNTWNISGTGGGADGAGGIGVEGGNKEAPHDYGRSATRLPSNARVETGCNTQVGNAYGPIKKSTVYDPSQVARTTRKEANIHQERFGNVTGREKQQNYVRDPNNQARTTRKETNVDNERFGNVTGREKQQNYVRDPNNVMRTTRKETTIDNERFGNVNGRERQQNYVHDPNNVMRTTRKETTLDKDYLGGATQNIKQTLVKDPTDVPAPTRRNTLDDVQSTGNVGGPQQLGDGYRVSTVNAPNTQKQFLSDIERTGNAHVDTTAGAYDVIDVVAPNTQKQFLSDHEYTGGAGNGNDQGNPVYGAAYNATTHTYREEVAEGREPTVVKNTLAAGADLVNLKSNRLVGDSINTRELVGNSITAATPEAKQCSMTNTRNPVSNAAVDERLDPRILDAFRENPYTHSLHSFAWN